MTPRRQLFFARLRRACAGLVAFSVLLLAHWWYAYSPRLRPAEPTGPEAALLEVPWAETAAFIPYPHQNLRALERRSGLPRDAVLDVLVLAGVEAPRLPAFGGMLSPPAHSLTLATGAEGQLAVAVRVYPAFAAFARLAGRLANNPWLHGGEVEWRERKVLVRWEGTLWLAGLPSLPQLGGAPPASSEALLVAAVRRPSSPFPPGGYRLRLEGEDLVLRSGLLTAVPTPGAQVPAGAGGDGLWGSAGTAGKEDAPLLGLVAAGRRGGGELGAEIGPGPSPQAMLFFGQDAEAITELPRAAVVHGGGKRWDLPAEGLLDLAGRSPPVGHAGRWQVVATDGAAVAATRSLESPLAARLSAAERGELELDLWLQLRPASAELTRLRRGLEKAPFVGRRSLRRWQAADRLLAGLSLRHSALRVVVTRSEGLELRVAARPHGDEVR